MDDERLDDLVPRSTWTPERHAAVARRLLYERRRGPALGIRVLGFAGATLAAMAIAFYAVPRWRPGTPEKSRPLALAPTPPSAPARNPAADEAGRKVILSDDSVVTLFGQGTDFRLQRTEAGLVSGRLVGEGARFEITHNPRRRFVVEAGPVVVEVLGTIFTVRVEPHSVDVRCDRGRVRVSWPGGGRTELTAGTNGSFPAVSDASEAAPPATSGEPGRPGKVTAPVKIQWRKKGSSSSARPARQVAASLSAVPSYPTTLATAPVPPPAAPIVDSAAPTPTVTPTAAPTGSVQRPPPTATELMARADRARQDGRFHTATDLLEELLARYPVDQEASAAAFTLGRLYLERIKNPLQAANAFFLCRRLAPRGPLAEDALARAAEALQQADRTTEAAQTAREYLDRYPEGSWAPVMARLVRTQ